ncbi:MAG: ATP-grasp domain-containing protein [Candidatus Kapaibacterium sp.]
MTIFFCAEPFSSPAVPDPTYQREADAARSAGMAIGLIDFESLVDEKNAVAAVRRVRAAATPEIAIYRGWMLRPEDYDRLYNALRDRGYLLINTPDAYLHCHYLPESYAIIAAHTPSTIWIGLEDMPSADGVIDRLVPFGGKSLIIKDYVKSRKHEWSEACYIPDASDRGAAARVVETFIERQGAELAGGLVFREFVELRPLAAHSRSGMPLTQEFRRFYLDGNVLLTAEYWEEGEYDIEPPPEHLFQEIAGNVRSRFFTMDIACDINGTWLIVELGDAQVAGLPEAIDPSDFYRDILSACSATEKPRRTIPE